MNTRTQFFVTARAVLISGIAFLATPRLEAQNLASAAPTSENTFMQLLIPIFAVVCTFAVTAGFFLMRSRKQAAREQELQSSLEATKIELAVTSRHLNEAMQFRFQVLNIAANDLKNPLVAVVNFGELLNEPDMTPSEREVITGQASGMAERALGLINALLEAHQLDVGQVRAHIGIVSLLPILHKTVERYRLLAKHKSIIIFNEYPLPTQAEIFVQADETMTRQVLENIISNAVKFTDFNRSVIIRVLQGETDSFVEKELPNNREELTQNARKQSPKRIRIEVQDEGPGISPEDMKRMFGMFTRLSARPTGGESSTGVGLSIVKRMVETMNGRVWCESQIGSGTTFVIELPSAEK